MKSPGPMELRHTHAPPDHRGRSLLLALCFLALAQAAVAIFIMWPQIGALGLTAKQTATPFVDRLVVAPNSVAEKSGLQSGDDIDARQLDAQARVRLQHAPRVGEPIALAIVSGGGARTVTVTATERVPVTWSRWLRLSGVLWTVLFCAILAWHRSANPEVRLLVLAVLFVYAMSAPLNQTNWITPSAA
ncbi:MAG: serine protease, partial [Candidatus Eremiobacteraeota bacterium]|nr:serine protease [Candidatus Eremiobacteraeota bacterium]